jgi:hypothetical protein
MTPITTQKNKVQDVNHLTSALKKKKKTKLFHRTKKKKRKKMKMNQRTKMKKMKNIVKIMKKRNGAIIIKMRMRRKIVTIMKKKKITVGHSLKTLKKM